MLSRTGALSEYTCPVCENDTLEMGTSDIVRTREADALFCGYCHASVDLTPNEPPEPPDRPAKQVTH